MILKTLLQSHGHKFKFSSLQVKNGIKVIFPPESGTPNDPEIIF